MPFTQLVTQIQPSSDIELIGFSVRRVVVDLEQLPPFRTIIKNTSNTSLILTAHLRWADSVSDDLLYESWQPNVTISPQTLDTSYGAVQSNAVAHFLQTTKSDILCYDRAYLYNCGYNEQDDYFKQTPRVQRLALDDDIPFYIDLQAVGTNGRINVHPDWQVANEIEIRWSIHSSLAHGVHGIVEFHGYHKWNVVGKAGEPQVCLQKQTPNTEIDRRKEIVEHPITIAGHPTNDHRYNSPFTSTTISTTNP